MGQKAGGRGRKKLPGQLAREFRSSDAVGQAVGVSGRTVRRVELVAKSRPDLIPQVAAGAISIERAVHLTKIEEARQIRSRMIQALPDPSGDQVPNNTAALVFADPPYARELVHLYRDLGAFAARVLPPGGSVVTYSGNGHLFDVQPLIAESGLRFWWTCIALHFDPETQDPARRTNQFQRMREHGVMVCYKSLLWFVKERHRHGGFVRDAVYAPREKDLHPWQQPVGIAKHFIEALTEPGDLVVDPFAGSGTTLVAAKELGRRWIGFEIDSETAKSARARLEGKAA